MDKLVQITFNVCPPSPSKPFQDKMTLQIESVYSGTTNPKSSAWDSIICDASIIKLFHTLDIPVYHTERQYNRDIGYDNKGRRTPYVESIDLYIWTVSNEGLPIIHLYDIDPRSKHTFLRNIITNPVQIRRITIDEDDEEDDMFSRIYDAIYKIVSTS